MRDGIKKYTRIAAGITGLLLLGLLFLQGYGVFGVRAHNLEADARKAQKIDPDWQAVQSVTDNIAALLFYNEELSNFTYSIYLNRQDFSFGYFFRSSGQTFDIAEGIKGFSYENALALVSLNQVNVVKVERRFEDPSLPPESYEVEPGEPFAVTFSFDPSGPSGFIHIYDRYGNTVPITNISVGE